MDSCRYVLALIFTCAFIPFFFYWPLIHGFVGFWRRVGPKTTFLAVWGGMILGAAGLFGVRDALILGDLGTNGLLMAIGVVCLGLASWVRTFLRHEMTFGSLIGVPELAPDRSAKGLVRTGLYAHVRHPRYTQLLLALVGWALIVNYLVLYVLVALWLPAVFVIAVLEERELRDRFGDEYERYSRDVPRFIPRFRRGG